MKSSAVVFAVVLLTWGVFDVSGFSPWLGEKLVSIGDRQAEVRAKCGAPLWTNLVATESSRSSGPNGLAIQKIPVEQWSYSLGRDSLLEILTFKAGVLVKIEEGDRVRESPPSRQQSALTLGDSEYDILQKFGEPLSRNIVGTETTRTDGQEPVLRESKVEQWTYSFGPGTFLKILTFKDGRLVKMEDGERQ